jgi:dienelactone hydrolase
VSRMSVSRWLLSTAALFGSVLFPLLAGDTAAAGAAAAVTPKYAVGTVTDTFVDPRRTTPAWDGRPELPTRTLVTTILYPASGPTGGSTGTGATPDKSAGPFPLIVFAHGLGGTPQGYINVLTAWASEGFVVAAPLFPLSNANVPGGPDAGDVVNQPEDMSYAIDAVLHDSALPSGTLSGLVDPKEIGAAGHSNGAVTTLGLVANTCCYDSRVKAAIVMAGTTEGFPPGHYDFSKAPPLLLVHGTADPVPERSIDLQRGSRAQGPPHARRWLSRRSRRARSAICLDHNPHYHRLLRGLSHRQSRGPFSSVHRRAQSDYQDRVEPYAGFPWRGHRSSTCPRGSPPCVRITGPQSR